MKTFSAAVRIAALAALAALVVPARAQVPGGGPKNSDCYIEWSGITPNKGKNLDCQDGDPSCDVDGTRNGRCVLGIGVCLAQTNVPECTPFPVQKATVKVKPKTIKVGGANIPIQAPVPPPVPISTPTCSAESVVVLPLKVKKNGKVVNSQQLTFTATAVVDGKPKKDNDTIKVRCVPNKGGGQCNANPAGGPSELQLVTAASGTDLDNGWTGGAHGFPVVPNSELRVCLNTCDTSSNPQCAEDEAQTSAVNGATFGPPLPLLTTIPPVAPVCVVNRFGSTKITGFNANIATGVVSGNVNLLSDVFLTSTTQVCPRCLPTTAAGQVGTCDSGSRQGRACTTGGVVTVQNASGNKTYPVSADCPPAGSPSGTIPINLPLTTATSTLAGSPPCPGQSQVLPTGCGSCGPASVCTPGSPACVSTTPTGDCVDLKGGINQNCCTNIPTNPCFPTPIVRTGSAAPPTPPFPDATYPKTGNATLVATYCEASSGANLVDFQTGLPGPGALVLPVTTTWSK